MPHEHTIDQEVATAGGLEYLLTDQEVAKITRMSLAWVRRRRLLNDGPPFRRLGGCIRYDPAELRAWLSSRPAGGDQAQDGSR